MICAVNVQRKWDTQTSSVTLRTNFRDSSEVSSATAFPQELRQHAVTSAEAHIPILQSGHVGCAKCYEIFGDQLLPSIRRIHGNTTHCGKNSRFGTKKAEKSAEMTKKDKIKALKKELDKAISEQNFEHAAELRDQIKEMEA